MIMIRISPFRASFTSELECVIVIIIMIILPRRNFSPFLMFFPSRKVFCRISEDDQLLLPRVFQFLLPPVDPAIIPLETERISRDFEIREDGYLRPGS